MTMRSVEVKCLSMYLRTNRLEKHANDEANYNKVNQVLNKMK